MGERAGPVRDGGAVAVGARPAQDPARGLILNADAASLLYIVVATEQRLFDCRA